LSKLQENERALAQLPLWKPLAASGVVWLATQFVAPADWSPAWWQVAQGAALLGVPVAYWLVVAHTRQHSVRDVMGDAPSGTHLLLALGAVCAGLAALVGWGSLFAWLGSLSVPGSPGPLSSATTPASVVGLVLCTVVLGPLAEELLFRGLIFGKFLRHARPAVAALFSSVLFGAFHSSPVMATLSACSWWPLYARSRSLWLPIVAHFANNLVAVALEWAVMVNAIQRPMYRCPGCSYRLCRSACSGRRGSCVGRCEASMRHQHTTSIQLLPMAAPPELGEA
jgi:membrane protease YdiL (CAAX protease family)